MITERDLDEAIAECMGQRNPDASTCIKLASFLIIRHHLFPDDGPEDGFKALEGHSHAVGNKSIGVAYDSGTELSEAAQGLTMDEVMPVFDELMDAVRVFNSSLYNATLRRLRNQ